VSWFGQPQLPESPDWVTLIGVAPEEYWNRCLGLLSGTKQGQFPSGAWPPFWELIGALGRWFDIHFAAVEGTWDREQTGGSPTITGARLLNLRSLAGFDGRNWPWRAVMP
jgi:hypothetical protein